MNEVWKDIVGYEGLYQVSNLGNVKNIKRNKLLSLKPKKQGYVRVNLVKEGIHRTFTVHRLVAMAFITKEDNKNLVNHKNEIKSDNRVSNLEWCTHQYNVTYGSRKRKTVINETISSESTLNKNTLSKSNRKGGERYMEQQAREVRNNYMREWRKNNPDKVKASQKRYWERRARRKSEANREIEGTSSIVKSPI